MTKKLLFWLTNSNYTNMHGRHIRLDVEHQCLASCLWSGSVLPGWRKHWCYTTEPKPNRHHGHQVGRTDCPSLKCNFKSINLLLSQYLWSAQINHFFSEHLSGQKKNKEPTRETDYICLYLFSSEHNFIHRSSSFHTFQKDHDFWDCLINYFIKVVKKLDVTWTKASIILQYTGSVIAIIITIAVMIRLYDLKPFSSL